MNVIERTTIKVIQTASNKAVVNIPSKIADLMKLEKGTELIVSLTECGQLVFERKVKHD